MKGINQKFDNRNMDEIQDLPEESSGLLRPNQHSHRSLSKV